MSWFERLPATLPELVSVVTSVGAGGGGGGGGGAGGGGVQETRLLVAVAAAAMEIPLQSFDMKR